MFNIFSYDFSSGTASGLWQFNMILIRDRPGQGGGFRNFFELIQNIFFNNPAFRARTRYAGIVDVMIPGRFPGPWRYFYLAVTLGYHRSRVL